jgi:hypothetical protein
MNNTRVQYLRDAICSELGWRYVSYETAQRIMQYVDDQAAPTRIEDMTNGNSAEMLRFEKWYGQREQHDSGLIETWNHTWEGWQARAALSVCADGGKGEAVALKGKHCQNGFADICHAAKADGVVCADGECDIDDGTRTAPQAECAPREAQPVPISDDHAHALYKLANMTGFVGWLNEFRKSIAATPAIQELAQESAGVLTDGQIREIWMRETGTTEQDSPLAVLDFARAVLAKKEGA